MFEYDVEPFSKKYPDHHPVFVLVVATTSVVLIVLTTKNVPIIMATVMKTVYQQK